MLSKFKTAILLFFLYGACMAQIPILDSDPANTTKVIYLDFDGQTVSGTGWNSGNTINALPSTMNATNIYEIFNRVCEDYCPFDVAITTDLQKFNSANATSRIRVIITPTSAWYGSAGGVAYVGSFNWGGSPGTPCWVFENMLAYSPKYIAEAVSHEAGHTFTLRHQSTYSYTYTPPPATCTKTAEYNPGQGNGVTSWAPIMGVGYYKNVTTFYNGTSAQNCYLIQNDLINTGTGLTSPGYLNFVVDDVGNTPNASFALNLNTLNTPYSGLISEPSDVDLYKFTICNSRYVSLDIKPWALDTTTYSGANLDVRLFLYDNFGNQLAVDTPLTKLNSRIGMNLNPGTYWFTVDAGGSANYSDYGSLGRYFINIKATNPPALFNSIVNNTIVCAGRLTALTYTSNGVANQWLWTVTGPTSGTYTTQNPAVMFNPGTHTITLMASGSNSASCQTTALLYVNPQPTVSINNATPRICDGTTTTFTANGASTYTWLPGGFGGSVHTVAPAINTTYSVTGLTGVCSNSAVTSVTVSPHFSVTAVASAYNICPGDTVVIIAGGASTYTFNPGNIAATIFTTAPSVTTSYTLTAQLANNACTSYTTITVTLKDCQALGIGQNQNIEDAFHLFPNPSHDYFVMETKTNDQAFEITNTLGQPLSRGVMKHAPHQIQVGTWPAGVYFVKLYSGAALVYSQKIIVE